MERISRQTGKPIGDGDAIRDHTAGAFDGLSDMAVHYDTPVQTEGEKMKRKCRRTDEERQRHERAVAIRKMTDDQLCEYIDDIITAVDVPIFPEIDTAGMIRDFIDALEAVDTPGERLSKQTIEKVRKLAVKMGYLPEVKHD